MYSDVVKSMYDTARQKQAQRTALIQQQFAQQQAALDEERMIKAAEIDQSIKELPQDALNYPAVLHDIERERALNNANFLRKSANIRASGMESGAAERESKSVDKLINERFGNFLKDFEETEQYKTANQNWNKINDKNARMNSLISQIAETRKILDSGDRAAALQNIKTNLLKPLSNIDSDDAIQIGEVLLKFAPVLSAPETALLAGKNVFNPSYYFTKYLNAQSKKDEKEKQSAFNGLIQNLEANPEEFLKTAIQGANGHIDSYNRRLTEQVINATSPGVAKRMGAVRMEYISPLENAAEKMPENKLATPNPFGQTISTGAGAAISPTAPAQETNVLNQPIGGSTIFRIKR